MYKVLIIGSGGREHALAWSMIKDKTVENVFCAPGNAGTSLIAKNIDININDNQEILDMINKYNIDYTIIGPEGPLENGIVDFLNKNNKNVFGPSRFSAQLETSKLFARNFMDKYEIPQPGFFGCKNEEEVMSVVSKLGLPLVLKADGLAAGKGVIICNNNNELNKAIDVMFTKKKFGSAAKKISVEECLKGEELSVFVLCDGDNYKIINSAQDHKRIYDDDKGPNTGGMGAYCPSPLFTDEMRHKVEERIIQPVIDGMKNEGSPYKGFLYVGLMIDNNNPYVIEFNVRMGDPETQVVIPMIEGSLFEGIKSSIDGNINNYNLKSNNGYAVTVVLAAKGYPDSYNIDMPISGLNNVNDALLFHSGTKLLNSKLVSNGGRVLNVVSINKTLEAAIKNAYQEIENISFNEIYYRKDIGKRGLCYIKENK